MKNFLETSWIIIIMIHLAFFIVLHYFPNDIKLMNYCLSFLISNALCLLSYNVYYTQINKTLPFANKTSHTNFKLISIGITILLAALSVCYTLILFIDTIKYYLNGGM